VSWRPTYFVDDRVGAVHHVIGELAHIGLQRRRQRHAHRALEIGKQVGLELLGQRVHLGDQVAVALDMLLKLLVGMITHDVNPFWSKMRDEKSQGVRARRQRRPSRRRN
jgi:hypothetical protein